MSWDKISKQILLTIEVGQNVYALDSYHLKQFLYNGIVVSKHPTTNSIMLSVIDQNGNTQMHSIMAYNIISNTLPCIPLIDVVNDNTNTMAVSKSMAEMGMGLEDCFHHMYSAQYVDIGS
jgi:hypothetical protein